MTFSYLCNYFTFIHILLPFFFFHLCRKIVQIRAKHVNVHKNAKFNFYRNKIVPKTRKFSQFERQKLQNLSEIQAFGFRLFGVDI